jgi:DNA-directed RNA polymerase subunit RPC12/RpoP
MAIFIASALARLVAITCPHCGHRKQVERRPAAFRICARCHRQFPDPLTPKPRAKRAKR